MVYLCVMQGKPYSMRGSFAINPDTGVITTNLLTYEDFARGYFLLTVAAYDDNNNNFNDTMSVIVSEIVSFMSSLNSSLIFCEILLASLDTVVVSQAVACFASKMFCDCIMIVNLLSQAIA